MITHAHIQSTSTSGNDCSRKKAHTQGARGNHKTCARFRRSCGYLNTDPSRIGSISMTATVRHTRGQTNQQFVHTNPRASTRQRWTQAFNTSAYIMLFLREREGLAQLQACRAGDVSAAPCLQVAEGELTAATRLRQARPLSACMRVEQESEHLGTRR